MKRIDTLNTEYIKMDRYEIPYIFYSKGNEDKVLIISHGFTSSKRSATAQMFFEALPEQGFAVLAYDFPAHGDSKVDGEDLSIDNCINDLERMEAFAKEALPEAEIFYLGSSFGAYITFQYLATKEHSGKKAFMRSAAVNMPDLFKAPTAQQQLEMETKGFVMWDAERPVKITNAFREDLLAHELGDIYKNGETAVEMIHGEKDDVINPEAAKKFAADLNIPITMVCGGGHRLMESNQPQLVLELAVKMFMSR